MQLPQPDALADLFELYEVTNRDQQRQLTLASVTATRYAKQAAAGEKPPVQLLEQAEWQTAEAFWLGVGLVPAIVDWPWYDLQELVGPILPGDVWTVGGRTGDGKSTFIANVVEPWAEKTQLTIAPLEQSPAVVQIKLACLWLGWDPAPVFRRQWHRLGLPESEARTLLQREVLKQGQRPLRDRVRYCPADTLDRDGLRRVIEQAAEWNHRLVIIDHLHQMDHGDGPENRCIRQTLRLAKSLARRYDLAVLFTAQIGRGDVRDRRRKFYAPELSDLQGSSAIEQVSDVVLLLYQPLLPTTKVSDIDAVLTDRKPYQSVFKPQTAAVKCAKHRLDGKARNRSVEFRFSDGRLSDLAPTWRQEAPAVRGDAYEVPA